MNRTKFPAPLPFGFRLLIVTDRHRVPGDLCERLDDALTAAPPGLAVLLREHDLATVPRLDMARKVRNLTAQRGVPLLLADRVDIALACDADGVQLGQRSVPADRVRIRWPHLLVGCSCHSADDLQSAADHGAHYATLSPVFATRCKPGEPPLGLHVFENLLSKAKLPVFALGGVNPDNVDRLSGLPLAGAAVVDGVLGAPSPERAVRALLKRMNKTLPNAVPQPPQ